MRRRLSSILLMLFWLGPLSFGGHMRQSASAEVGKTTTGKLNLSFRPYAGKGREDMPVEVLTFDVTAGDKGMWVRELRLKNRSDKTVAKIGMSLFVYSKDDPDTLLLRHSTIPQRDLVYGVRLRPGQEWPKGTCSPAALSCLYSFAMMPASELLKPLAQSGDPEGDYIIALGIDKVWFADGTNWELGAAKDN